MLMPEIACLSLSVLDKSAEPFLHFTSASVLKGGMDQVLLDWLENTDLWTLTETSFYTQFEFSLLDIRLPDELQPLTSEAAINQIRHTFSRSFQQNGLELVGITAHKLVEGHRMGVHNDFLGDDETHRLVIQLNRYWKQENGGFLMLFNSRDPNDVATVIQPIHNSAIGFEISPNSYHAVSTVHDFCRYTLVYTFKNNP